MRLQALSTISIIFRSNSRGHRRIVGVVGHFPPNLEHLTIEVTFIIPSSLFNRTVPVLVDFLEELINGVAFPSLLDISDHKR
jgi:hypothetical protein